MELRSLGLRTDLIFHRASAEVTDRGDRLTIRTPGHPEYYWGNFIVFGRAPAADDVDRWERVFADDLGDDPAIQHRSFTWETSGLARGASPEAIAAFEAQGYEHDVTTVLTTRAVRPAPHPRHDYALRRIESDGDWAQVHALQVVCRDEDFTEPEMIAFYAKRIAQWRALIARGSGLWLGAFLGGVLCADAGLFWADDIGRFQNVETHPAHRRRGLCGTLVHRLATIGTGELHLRDLVIEAEGDGDAVRIYRALGFVDTELLETLWHPPQTKARDHV